MDHGRHGHCCCSLAGGAGVACSALDRGGRNVRIHVTAFYSSRNILEQDICTNWLGFTQPLIPGVENLVPNFVISKGYGENVTSVGCAGETM